MNIYVDELKIPLGPMTILACEQSVVRIDYGTQADLAHFHQQWLEKNVARDEIVMKQADLNHVKTELSEYFAGERKQFTFDFQLIGTTFQMQVWKALFTSVPYGKTASYKQVAAMIDNPKAVRAVGGAVNKNPLTIVVPCHRVIGANGKMVGYNGGLDKKEYLLHIEANDWQ